MFQVSAHNITFGAEVRKKSKLHFIRNTFYLEMVHTENVAESCVVTYETGNCHIYDQHKFIRDTA